MSKINTMFVGREKEKEILNKALMTKEAELIAVIGRRRVGKTFLVRNTYNQVLKFELTGIQHGTRAEQLRNFVDQLSYYSQSVIPIQPPKNWFDAFKMLKLFLAQLKSSHKIAVFFDELPWMATHKSGFLKAFGLFWNSWASQQNVVIVICGSAASWMIQKVVRNKGGLHNRITRRIALQPFDLAETKTFLYSRNVQLDHYQIIQIYMAMGGIPHYLKEVQSGKSASQNIDEILFSKNGLLRDEFDSLYPALFDNSATHVKIIQLLAQKWKGLTREEIIHKGKFSNGGSFTKTLDELTQAGFIAPFYSFGKKKKSILYRLVDEYSLFYLKFIQNKRLEEEGSWTKFSQGQTYKIWAGYAYENICLKHLTQIKKALGITGVYSEASVFQVWLQNGQTGTQIDLVIDRNDQTINLFEIKFYSTEFVISKAYAKELRTKKETFRLTTQTKKQLFLGMITTFGLHQNENSLGLVDNVLTMDELFG